MNGNRTYITLYDSANPLSGPVVPDANGNVVFNFVDYKPINAPTTTTYTISQQPLYDLLNQTVAGDWTLSIVNQDNPTVPDASLNQWVLTLPVMTNQFAVPNPVNGVPFQLPYATNSLPVIVPGPHAVSTAPVPTSAGTVVTTTAGSANSDAVQTLTFTAVPAGGQFTLTYFPVTPPGGTASPSLTTSAISYSSSGAVTAGNILTALDALTYAGASPLNGNVQVALMPGTNNVFTITFVNALSVSAQNNLVASATPGGLHLDDV